MDKESIKKMADALYDRENEFLALKKWQLLFENMWSEIFGADKQPIMWPCFDALDLDFFVNKSMFKIFPLGLPAAHAGSLS